MPRRQIEIAMRYIWRERGATNLYGGHVVRPILIGLALGRPADNSLLMARNSPEKVETISPTPRFSIAVSSTWVEILPSHEGNIDHRFQNHRFQNRRF